MTYEYAVNKIENIFNHELEHIDRIHALVGVKPNWIEKNSWIRLMETAIFEYKAAARVVIEIYIELASGVCENWRDLHKIAWEYENRLNIIVERNKKEIDKL